MRHAEPPVTKRTVSKLASRHVPLAAKHASPAAAFGPGIARQEAPRSSLRSSVNVPSSGSPSR
jgi:hypothetical protein